MHDLFQEIPQIVTDNFVGKALDNKKRKAKTKRTAPNMATANISVDDYLCLSELEYDALDIIEVAVSTRVGFEFRKPHVSYELPKATTAFNKCWRQSLHDLKQKAKHIGADGIVNIKIKVQKKSFPSRQISMVVYGTAVRRISRDNNRQRKHHIFTTSLTAKEILTLNMAGRFPYELVVGFSVYHFGFRSVGDRVKTFFRNIELINFTESLYAARNLALANMQRDFSKNNLNEIIGIKLSSKKYKLSKKSQSFLAIGNCVRSVSDLKGCSKPTFVVSI